MEEAKAGDVITVEGKDISPETVEEDERRAGAEIMVPVRIVENEATM